MKCIYSKSRNTCEGIVRLNSQKIPMNENFRYLGSVIYKDWEIKDYVNHTMRGCRLHIKLNKKFYKTAIRLCSIMLNIRLLRSSIIYKDWEDMNHSIQTK